MMEPGDGAGEGTMRIDDAAQPPFESLRGRREAALFSPLVPPTTVPCTRRVQPARGANSRGRAPPRQVSHVSRLPSTGEFDPSPHARRMCNLCGMTRTCAICRSVSSLHSTPFASPHKAPGATRSLLAVGGQRSGELPRATLSEWELMSKLTGDSYGPGAGGNGRKARSKSMVLSRGTTVSSRMRDAYIDQETFRGRYGKMLAQYSSMQSLVHELQHELSQRSFSNDTPAPESDGSLQTVRELQHRAAHAEHQQQQIVARVKRDMVTMIAVLKGATALAREALTGTNATVSLIHRSLVPRAVGLASPRTGRGAMASKTRTILALSIRLWCSVLSAVRERAAAVVFVSRRLGARGLLKEVVARWASLLSVLDAHLSIIVKMGEDQRMSRDCRVRKFVLRTWRRFFVCQRRAHLRLRLAARRAARAALGQWLAQVALGQRHRRVVLRLQKHSKRTVLARVCTCWLTLAQRKSRDKRVMLREHARCNRLLLLRSLDRLKSYARVCRRKGPRQEAAHRMRLSRIFKAWHVHGVVHHRAAVCLARAGLRVDHHVKHQAWGLWVHYVARKRAAPKMNHQALLYMSQHYHKNIFQDWRTFVRSTVEVKARRLDIVVKAMRVSFHTWRDTYREQRAYRKKLNRVVLRIKMRTAAVALDLWGEYASLQADQRAKVRRLAHRIFSHCLVNAFLRWADETRLANGLKARARNLMSSLLHSSAVGALRRWVEFVHEIKHVRNVLSNLLHRLLNRALASALAHWADYTQEVKEFRTKSAKIVAVLASDTLSLVMQEWVHYTRQHRKYGLAAKALACMCQTVEQADAFSTWRQVADWSSMVRRSSSSLQRTVFEAYVHAVRRQRQSRVLFGTLSNRRGTTIEHCTLYEWHRKVKLYNVVRQRCKMRGWRLVTRIFHLWLRSALYTALMRKARHMMHEVHHIQVQEFATRRANFMRRFRASFYLWRMYVAVMYEAQTQQAKALRRFISNTCRPFFSSWTRCVEHAHAIEDSTVRALQASTSLKNSHRMLIPVPFRKAL